MNVGFSTGCLYKSGIAFDELIRMYRGLGAAAIELGFATPRELKEFVMTQENLEYVSTFRTVMIHAPFLEAARYRDDSATREMLDKLRLIYEKTGALGIVIHPDRVEDFRVLQKSGLPFKIENMDSRKSCGTQPEHIQKMRKYGFGFVLDLQHAYEHDQSMGVAQEILAIMGEKLSHLHVSGQRDGQNHSLVHLAENREAIADFLEQRISVPKILEGIILDKETARAIARQELDFIRGYDG